MKSDIAGPGGLSNLDLKIRSGRLDTGLLQELEAWLDKQNGNARLIVVDTLASVRGQSTNSRTLYEQDYEVGAALTKLAGDYSVALVPIHHLKKGDAEDPLDLVSGSTGLTGGMDGAMVLTRTRSAADGILKAVHRDLENDPEIALQLVDKESGWWKYAGEAAEYKLGKERREILEALANSDEPLKPKEIAEALDKATPNVSKLLQKMREDGDVDNEGYGRYVLAHGTTIPTLDTTTPIQVVQAVQVEAEVELGSVGSVGSVGKGIELGGLESGRGNLPATVTDRSQLALDALTDESSGVRETVLDCMGGRYDKDHKTGASAYQGGSLGVTAGALAKYHGEAAKPGAWKDWMKAAALLVDEVSKEQGEED